MRATIWPLRGYAKTRTGSRMAKLLRRRSPSLAGMLSLLLACSAQAGVEGRIVQTGFLADTGGAYGVPCGWS